MLTRLICCLCLIACTTAHASAANRITFFRDGALLRQEASAVKGVINIPLAAGFLEQTLTITPAPGTTISAVETSKSPLESASNKDLEILTEQRRRLEDRLQALETREAIFTSAAKSQSGKAPRKTKTNPDPVQTIRQGTDFAIAQLEAVYTARRKATQEIRKIDVRLAAAKKRNHPAEDLVRITVTPPRGAVTISYATTEQGWQPNYNLNLSGNGSAQLQLYARLTGNTRGRQVSVSAGSLAENATAEIFPARSDLALLAIYRFPITEEHYTEGIFNCFSGTITNSSQRYLPSGESALFRNGTYLGKFIFEGFSSGRNRHISMGKQD